MDNRAKRKKSQDDKPSIDKFTCCIECPTHWLFIDDHIGDINEMVDNIVSGDNGLCKCITCPLAKGVREDGK